MAKNVLTVGVMGSILSWPPVSSMKLWTVKLHGTGVEHWTHLFFRATSAVHISTVKTHEIAATPVVIAGDACGAIESAAGKIVFAVLA